MFRYVPFETGEFYHVFNRGIDKRRIFFSSGDWVHFQRLMYICNDQGGARIRRDRIKKFTLCEIKELKGEQLVDIIAYVMLDNHFHILLREKTKGGISKFMAKLLTSYAKYMNTKYNRTGPLMCRPFRSRHVDSDEYFRWLISYIHMNPIDKIDPNWKENGISNKKEALKFLREYRYSSYRDYFVLDRDEGLILNKGILPIKIEDIEDLKGMLEELSEYNASVLRGS